MSPDLVGPDTSIDPYEVLNVTTTATEADIKSSYKKLALKHHPDKVAPEDRAHAHSTFQTLALAYAILSSPARRKLYDTTGNTSDSLHSHLDSDPDFNWSDFFRAQYAELVTTSTITDFKSTYQGSEDEKRDVMDAYTKTSGVMERIYEKIMLSNCLDDEARFRGYIDQGIASEEVKSYKAYTDETKKSREKRFAKARREARDAEKHVKELAESITAHGRGGRGGKSAKDKCGVEDAGLGDLAALISQRQQGHQEAFLDAMEAKYARNGAKKRKATVEAEQPDEEAFQAAAKRLKLGEKDVKSNGAEQAAKMKPTRKSRAVKVKVVELDEHDEEGGSEDEEEVKPPKKKGTARKIKANAKTNIKGPAVKAEVQDEEGEKAKKRTRGLKRKVAVVKEEENEEAVEEEEDKKHAVRKRKSIGAKAVKA